MLRKLMLTTAAVAGVMFATGAAVEAGHGHGHGHGGHHHGHRGHHHGHNHGYRGGYYGGGVVIAPRYVAPPVYNYGYPGYGNPYGCQHNVPYGSGYQPYGQSFGLRTGNFSLYLGR